MGSLRCAAGGRRLTLGDRTVVGRSPSAGLRLDHPSVSAEHGTVYWHDDAWWVRDLGSTNGTFVGPDQLGPGEKHRLEAGAAIRFGDDDPQLVWTLESDQPPGARAVASSNVRVARGGLLLLPSEDVPTVSVFLDEAGRWIAERGDEMEEVADQRTLIVDDLRWRLCLPPGQGAADVSTTMPTRRDLRVLEACSMDFRVSRDEEYVEVLLACGPERFELPPRSFHYTLLTLARRLVDDRGLPPPERGWIYADELASQLGTSRPKLNLDVCRARQQVAELGIEGAGRLVQRRRTSHQLRLGVPRVRVAPFG